MDAQEEIDLELAKRLIDRYHKMREYQAKYREEHKDKIKEYQRVYKERRTNNPKRGRPPKKKE